MVDPRLIPVRCVSASEKHELGAHAKLWVYTFEADVDQMRLQLRDDETEAIADGVEHIKPTVGGAQKFRIVADGPMPDFVPNGLYALTLHEINPIPADPTSLVDTLKEMFGEGILIVGGRGEGRGSHTIVGNRGEGRGGVPHQH